MNSAQHENKNDLKRQWHRNKNTKEQKEIKHNKLIIITQASIKVNDISYNSLKKNNS